MYGISSWLEMTQGIQLPSKHRSSQPPCWPWVLLSHTTHTAISLTKSYWKTVISWPHRGKKGQIRCFPPALGQSAVPAGYTRGRIACPSSARSTELAAVPSRGLPTLWKALLPVQGSSVTHRRDQSHPYEPQSGLEPALCFKQDLIQTKHSKDPKFQNPQVAD